MSSAITNFGAVAPSTTTLPTIVKWKPSATGAAAFPILDLGTAGQVLTVNAGATDFSWVTPSSTPLSPNIITTATATLVAGQPNIITFTGLCTVTMPLTANVGQIVQVTGSGTSTFIINLAGNQSILCPGDSSTSLTGSVEATTVGTVVTMICIGANNDYVVTSNTNVLTIA